MRILPCLPALLLTFPLALAAAGNVDLTFGDGGFLWLDGNRQATDRAAYLDLLLDQKGRYVGVGYRCAEEIDLPCTGLVTRRMPSGDRDPTFADQGLYAFTSNAGEMFVGREQADGKLLIGGHGRPHGQPMICRLNENGTRDAAFGTLGCVDLRSATGISPIVFVDLVLTPDGGSVALVHGVGGKNRSYALVNLTATGSLDVTFGECPACGVAYSPTALQTYLGAGALIVDDAASRIQVAATLNVAPLVGFVTVFHSLDSGTFEHTAEFVRLPDDEQGFATAPIAQALHLMPDGSALMSGSANYADADPGRHAVVVKFNANDKVDVTFGVHGVRRVRRYTQSVDRSILQSDGKLLLLSKLGGQVDELLRIDSSTGANDVRFGIDGTVALSSSAVGSVAAVAGGRYITVSGGEFETVDGNGAFRVSPYLLRIDRDGIFSDEF